MIEKLWVVEGHPVMRGLHFETVERMIERNRASFEEGKEGLGYVPLVFCRSSGEAQEAVRILKRKEREVRDGQG